MPLINFSPSTLLSLSLIRSLPTAITSCSRSYYTLHGNSSPECPLFRISFRKTSCISLVCWAEYVERLRRRPVGGLSVRSTYVSFSCWLWSARPYELSSYYRRIGHRKLVFVFLTMFEKYPETFSRTVKKAFFCDWFVCSSSTKWWNKKKTKDVQDWILEPNNRKNNVLLV